MVAKKTARPVIVSTANRGIFFGYTSALGPVDGEIELTKCRMVVYYPPETRSMVGLTTLGALKGSRISPPADRAVLINITSVMDVAADAVDSFEKGPWA